MNGFILDDRGRRVPFVHAIALASTAPPRLRHRVMRARLYGLRMLLPPALGLSFGIVISGLAVGDIGSDFVERAVLAGEPVAALVVLCLPAYIFVAAGARRNAAAECLAHRYCASCGYNFAGVPSDHDGCAVCPECGAAWRVVPRGAG